MKTVEEIMTANPSTCRAGDTLERAAQIMWEHDCGCVPVVDCDGRPIAMITDRDVCMASYTQGKPLGAILVDSAMSRGLLSVCVSETVAAAEGVMRRHGVRRLPVVDRGAKLVGVLSIADILNHADIPPTGPRDGLSVHAVAVTLEAICRPSRTGRCARAA